MMILISIARRWLVCQIPAEFVAVSRGIAAGVALYRQRVESEPSTPGRSPMNDLAGAASSTDLSAAACLVRAHGLIPVLQAAAGCIEANNELPPDVLDAMHEAWMF